MLFESRESGLIKEEFPEATGGEASKSLNEVFKSETGNCECMPYGLELL